MLQVDRGAGEYKQEIAKNKGGGGRVEVGLWLRRGHLPLLLTSPTTTCVPCQNTKVIISLYCEANSVGGLILDGFLKSTQRLF